MKSDGPKHLVPASQCKSLAIFARPFIGEEVAEVVHRLQQHLVARGLSVRAPVLHSPLRKVSLPRDTILITDNLARFVTDSVFGAIQLLLILVERGCSVYVLGVEPALDVSIDETWLTYLKMLGHDLPKAYRGMQIRAGQHLARARGLAIGRPVLSADLERAVLDALSEGKSIRAVERDLRARGFQVSRSTIGRLARIRKAGGR